MSNSVLSAYGRIGQAPREHQTKTGTAMVTASLAVSLDCRGEDEPATWWLSLVAFGKTAEQLHRCEKGDLLGIVGRLQLSRWQGPDGDTKEQHQVIVDQLVSARTVRPGGKRKADGDSTGRERQASVVAQSPPRAGEFNDNLPF